MAFSAAELLIVFIIGAVVFFIGHKKAKGKVKAIGGLIAVVSLILIVISLLFGGF